MINQKALKAVINSTFSKEFCWPLYDSYCFSRVHGTVLKLLTGDTSHALPSDTIGDDQTLYDSVIVLFIDGFGWTFFEKHFSRFPFLNRFVQEGIASKMTSLFPSTTAAHVTCVNTGLEGGLSGVYEWFIYEPGLDRIIAPLPYSFAGDHHLNSLKNEPVTPEELFPTRTIYQQLKEQNIESFTIQHIGICDSPYTKTILNGSHVFGYHHFTDGLLKLTDLYAKNQHKKSYFYCYFADIDSVAHRKGVDSDEFESSIENCFLQLEEIFWKNFLKAPHKKTAIILIADHGLTAVDPTKTFYLNKEIPQIKKNFLIGADQKPLTPAGSCRDYFLHIRDEKLLETKEILERFLKDKAEIYLTEDLIKKGLFGNRGTTQTFLSRVGNLVILPKKSEGVWWFEKNRFAQNFHASHGGLTREEMEIPFLFLPTV